MHVGYMYLLSHSVWPSCTCIYGCHLLDILLVTWYIWCVVVLSAFITCGEQWIQATIGHVYEHRLVEWVNEWMYRTLIVSSQWCFVMCILIWSSWQPAAYAWTHMDVLRIPLYTHTRTCCCFLFLLLFFLIMILLLQLIVINFVLLLLVSQLVYNPEIGQNLFPVCIVVETSNTDGKGFCIVPYSTKFSWSNTCAFRK